jgi:hypothetical protein
MSFLIGIITGFSGSEGGPNFTGLYPAVGLSDDAIATTRTPTVKKALTTTNQAHTTGSNVAIGEEATYTVTVTVPEGRGQDVHLIDTLPSGLALTAVDSITASPALASSVGTMNTRLFNSNLIYDVILVVVLGGIGLSGGRGGVLNVVVGTLLIGTLVNGITIYNVSSLMQDFIKGLILLLAILIDSFVNPRNEETAQQGDI